MDSLIGEVFDDVTFEEFEEENKPVSPVLEVHCTVLCVHSNQNILFSNCVNEC